MYEHGDGLKCCPEFRFAPNTSQLAWAILRDHDPLLLCDIIFRFRLFATVAAVITVVVIVDDDDDFN